MDELARKSGEVEDQFKDMKDAAAKLTDLESKRASLEKFPFGESPARKIIRLEAEAEALKERSDALGGLVSKEGADLLIEREKKRIEVAQAENEMLKRALELKQQTGELEFSQLSKKERLAQLTQDIADANTELAMTSDDTLLGEERQLELKERILALQKKFNNEVKSGGKQANLITQSAVGLMDDLAGAMGQAAFNSQSFGQLAIQIFRQFGAQVFAALIKLIIFNAILKALGVPIRFNLAGPVPVSTGGGSVGTPPLIPGNAAGGFQFGGPKLSVLNEEGPEFVVKHPFATLFRPALELANRGISSTALSQPSLQPSFATASSLGSGDDGGGGSAEMTIIVVGSMQEAKRLQRNSAVDSVIVDAFNANVRKIRLPGR